MAVDLLRVSCHRWIFLRPRSCTRRSQRVRRFLPRDAMLSAVYAVVVRLSVCLYVFVCHTPVCIKTAKRRIMQIMPQTGSDMPYGHLIAATVMTLGVCQGYSLTASFFLYCISRSLCHSRAFCTVYIQLTRAFPKGSIPRHRHRHPREEIARVGHVGEDHREDIGVSVGVGVVECGLLA